MDNDEMARRWMWGHGGLRVRSLRGRKIFIWGDLLALWPGLLLLVSSHFVHDMPFRTVFTFGFFSMRKRLPGRIVRKRRRFLCQLPRWALRTRSKLESKLRYLRRGEILLGRSVLMFELHCGKIFGLNGLIKLR